MGVGFPAVILLNEFGSQIWAAFGGPPYLVGSALTEKSGWRDVDVRMIIDDQEWKRLGFGDPATVAHRDAKWISLCLAYSALGKAMTGLPIDFQLQQQTKANEEFPSAPRSALGLVPLRFVEDAALAGRKP